MYIVVTYLGPTRLRDGMAHWTGIATCFFWLLVGRGRGRLDRANLVTTVVGTYLLSVQHSHPGPRGHCSQKQQPASPCWNSIPQCWVGIVLFSSYTVRTLNSFEHALGRLSKIVHQDGPQWDRRFSATGGTRHASNGGRSSSRQVSFSSLFGSLDAISIETTGIFITSILMGEWEQQ